MREGMRAYVAAGALLLAGCGARSLPSEPPAPSLRIGWLSYSDDGTLVAASRERVVLLDPALNEIDRVTPRFPFDPAGSQPGLMFFGVSRDARVAALGWQSDTYPKDPPTVPAGGIVFDVGTATTRRLDNYGGASTNFQGLALSPDGLTTAAVLGPDLQISAVDGGAVRWHAPKVLIAPPLFTPDSAALVVASDDTLEVVRASDGAHLTTIVPPGRDWFLSVAVSADGTTLAVASVTDLNTTTSTSTITTWGLLDGAHLGTAVLPADLGGGIPAALALSPHGDMVAASIVPGGADALLVWSGDRLLYRHDGETDFALSFSPDGATLATASAAARGVRLLRASDGALVATRILPVDPP